MEGFKTGGRKKGTPNKTIGKTCVVPTATLRARELKVDPFDIILKFAAGDWEGLGYSEATRTIFGKGGTSFEVDIIDPGTRLKAAIEACQFLYFKKGPEKMTEEDSELLKKAKEIEDKSITELTSITTQHAG